MRNYFLLLAFLPCVLFAQVERQWEFGLAVGNNGQLDKTLNDFYFFGHETGYLDDSKIDLTTNLKFNFVAGYRVNENWGARLKFGFAMRKDDYTDYWPTSWNNLVITQNVFGINPGVFFTKDLDRLQLSTGFEVPVYMVGEFKMEQIYREMWDSVNLSSEQLGTFKMQGGLIFGVNNFITLKYAVTDWLAVGGEISYGFLYADIGETVSTDVITTTSATPETYHSEYAKNYRKTFFSAPEVGFGLYFRL